jgi:ankyrin repeat protein
MVQISINVQGRERTECVSMPALLVGETTNNIPATPLQVACDGGKFEVAKFLIQHKADVNAPAGEEGELLTPVPPGLVNICMRQL